MIDFNKLKSMALESFDGIVSDFKSLQLVHGVRDVMEEASSLHRLRDDLKRIKRSLLIHCMRTHAARPFVFYAVCGAAERAVRIARYACIADEMRAQDAATEEAADSRLDMAYVEVTINDVIKGYDDMNAGPAIDAIHTLGGAELLFVRDHELENKNRKTVLGAIDTLAEDC